LLIRGDLPRFPIENRTGEAVMKVLKISGDDCGQGDCPR
jgi:hypothetical protein